MAEETQKLRTACADTAAQIPAAMARLKASAAATSDMAREVTRESRARRAGSDPKFAAVKPPAR